MSHWAERYVGRPWIEGRHDCADLVVAVAADVFGRRIVLPAHAASLRARDAQIEALRAEVAVRAGIPREGDVVLMRPPSRGRAVGRHIGVWCDVAGVASVLHCARDLGTCLHPLRRLARHGLAVEGVYRWR